jgi:hypothetical protein
VYNAGLFTSIAGVDRLALLFSISYPRYSIGNDDDFEMLMDESRELVASVQVTQ